MVKINAHVQDSISLTHNKVKEKVLFFQMRDCLKSMERNLGNIKEDHKTVGHTNNSVM